MVVRGSHATTVQLSAPNPARLLPLLLAAVIEVLWQQRIKTCTSRVTSSLQGCGQELRIEKVVWAGNWKS